MQLKDTKLLQNDTIKNPDTKKGLSSTNSSTCTQKSGCPFPLLKLMCICILKQFSVNKRDELCKMAETLYSKCLNSILQCAGSRQKHQQQQCNGKHSKEYTTKKQGGKRYPTKNFHTTSGCGSGGGDKDDNDDENRDQKHTPRDAAPFIERVVPTRKTKQKPKKKKGKRNGKLISQPPDTFLRVRKRYSKCSTDFSLKPKSRRVNNSHSCKHRKYDDYHSVVPFPAGSQASSHQGACVYEPPGFKNPQRNRNRNAARRTPQVIHKPASAKVAPTFSKPSASISKHSLEISAQPEKNDSEGVLTVGNQTSDGPKNPNLVSGFSPNEEKISNVEHVNCHVEHVLEESDTSQSVQQEGNSTEPLCVEGAIVINSIHPSAPNAIVTQFLPDDTTQDSVIVTGTHTDILSLLSKSETVPTSTPFESDSISEPEVLSNEQLNDNQVTPRLDAIVEAQSSLTAPPLEMSTNPSLAQSFSIPHEENTRRNTTKFLTRKQSLSSIHQIYDRQTSLEVRPQTPERSILDYPPNWTEAAQVSDHYPVDRLCLVVNSNEWHLSPPHAQAVSDVHTPTQAELRPFFSLQTQSDITRINRQFGRSDYVVTGTLVEITPFEHPRNNILGKIGILLYISFDC